MLQLSLWQPLGQGLRHFGSAIAVLEPRGKADEREPGPREREPTARLEHLNRVHDLDDEAERLSMTLGNNTILVMGNHGVMAVGETIAKAFDELYYFERACETYITALMTGIPLRIVSDAVAEKTAQQWQDYIHRVGLGEAFLSEIRVILDREEPDYRL